MEEDRAATNLGPDIEYDEPTEVVPEVKQPRKRFIGRRAAAERAAAKAADNDGSAGPDASTGALAAPKPTRTPRTLNQIPAAILHDDGIYEAISHLPSNYNFEIHKTIHRIRTSGATNIALQFPEGLLMFAPLISDILTQFCPGTDTLIMGDVTYGACCIDDFTARALGCDLLVHYGHSCLVPVDTTKGIKTLYVFVTIGIDAEHLTATVERNFQSGKRIALVGTIQFNSTLHAIVPRLRSLGYDPILPRSAPLSAGEILGCTAPSLTASSLLSSKSASPSTPTSTTPTTPSSALRPATDADLILYVGDGRFHLESILIASPTLRAHTYRYDPYTRRLTHETYEHTEMHSLRHSAIRAARSTLTTPSTRTSATSPPVPRTWAIILGTLGRQGNPHTLELIKAHLTHLSIPWITLLLSEVTPQKLALMSADVGVWVQIACPRLSIDWGYAFERPLLSPYEACVALGVKEGSGWGAVGEEGEGEVAVDEAVGDAEGEVGLYPMDFYAKEGLGRTRADEVPVFEEIEVV